MNVSELNAVLSQYDWGHLAVLDVRSEYDYRRDRSTVAVSVHVKKRQFDDNQLTLKCLNVNAVNFQFDRFRFRLDELRAHSERSAQVEEINFLITNSGQDGDGDPLSISCEDLELHTSEGAFPIAG